MKWGEFKKMVEEQGVTDDVTVDYIDWSSWHMPEVFDLQTYENGERACKIW